MVDVAQFAQQTAEFFTLLHTIWYMGTFARLAWQVRQHTLNICMAGEGCNMVVMRYPQNIQMDCRRCVHIQIQALELMLLLSSALLLLQNMVLWLLARLIAEALPCLGMHLLSSKNLQICLHSCDRQGDGGE